MPNLYRTFNIYLYLLSFAYVDDMAEKTQKAITIFEIDSDAMKQLIDYAYAGDILITEENVQVSQSRQTTTPNLSTRTIMAPIMPMPIRQYFHFIMFYCYCFISPECQQTMLYVESLNANLCFLRCMFPMFAFAHLPSKSQHDKPVLSGSLLMNLANTQIFLIFTQPNP